MDKDEKMELVRTISGGYELSIEEFQERLDGDIEAHRVAIELCNNEKLTEILKDSLIKLQELKIEDGGVH